MSKALVVRALELCRPFRKAIVAAIVLALLRTAVELAVPLAYRFVIDVAIPKGSVTTVLSGAVAYSLLSIAAAALGAGYTYFLTRAGLNIVLSLRSRLMDAVLRWPLSQWDDVSTGQVQARLVCDAQTLPRGRLRGRGKRTGQPAHPECLLSKVRGCRGKLAESHVPPGLVALFAVSGCLPGFH